MKSNLQWSSKTEQEIDAAINKNSPSYDKKFAKEIIEKHGSVENYKGKLKREKRRQDKLREIEKFKKALLEPNIKNNLIVWTDKYNNGSIYEGRFGKEKCFEIKRGILTFSIKTVHKELDAYNKTNSSTELIKLQEKANKILHDNPKFLLKFKSIS